MTEEFDDETENDDAAAPNGPKVLRDQNKKLVQELAEVRARADAAEANIRKYSVAEFLTSHGADVKLAKYVPGDVNDSDGVLAWLREDGDVFGWQPVEQDDEQGEIQEQAARVSRATLNAPSARTPAITPEAIKNMTHEERQRLYATLPRAQNG